MSLLVDLSGWLLALLLALGAYAVLSLVLLLYVELPDGSRYAPVEDLVFVVTLPFVAAVVLLSTSRRS